MICAYCRTDLPETGYCCQEAELATLRAVADEAIAMLECAPVEPTLGYDTYADVVRLTKARLMTARKAS